jgi:hypothetical protein
MAGRTEFLSHFYTEPEREVFSYYEAFINHHLAGKNKQQAQEYLSNELDMLSVMVEENFKRYNREHPRDPLEATFPAHADQMMRFICCKRAVELFKDDPETRNSFLEKICDLEDQAWVSRIRTPAKAKHFSPLLIMDDSHNRHHYIYRDLCNECEKYTKEYRESKMTALEHYQKAVSYGDEADQYGSREQQLECVEKALLEVEKARNQGLDVKDVFVARLNRTKNLIERAIEQKDEGFSPIAGLAGVTVLPVISFGIGIFKEAQKAVIKSTNYPRAAALASVITVPLRALTVGVVRGAFAALGSFFDGLKCFRGTGWLEFGHRLANQGDGIERALKGSTDSSGKPLLDGRSHYQEALPQVPASPPSPDAFTPLGPSTVATTCRSLGINGATLAAAHTQPASSATPPAAAATPARPDTRVAPAANANNANTPERYRMGRKI